jgi:hypothetical protein
VLSPTWRRPPQQSQYGSPTAVAARAGLRLARALLWAFKPLGATAPCVPLRTALLSRLLWDLKSHFTRLVRSRSQPLKSPAPLAVAFAMHKSGVPLGDLKSGALVFLSPYNYAKTPGLINIALIPNLYFVFILYLYLQYYASKV